MNTKARKFDIVNGPGKDALFDACKYAYGKSGQLAVDFAVAAGYIGSTDPRERAYFKMKIRNLKIAGIEHEDGTGENFNLHGYCQADLDSHHGPGNYVSYRFKAHYNTQRRQGTIQFLE